MTNTGLADLIFNDRISLGLRKWEAELPQIDCSGKALVGRILYLQDLMMSKLNQNLGSYGLKFQSYAILSTLRINGEPYRMTPSELLNRLVISSGGLSNLLRKLESDGLVSRGADERDGRGVIVQLTDKGLEQVEQAMVTNATLENEMVLGLNAEEQAVLAQALSKLIMFNSAR